jgi:SAM-dependent methyltransferase
MSWIDYWNDAPTIYVSDRHRAAHYRGIADGIVARIASPSLTVLDYGCGEALDAARVAAHCRQLYLFDAAPNVTEALGARFADVPNITVLSPAALAALPPGSVDLLVANSVVQYLDDEALADAMRLWARLLSPEGSLLLADIIPRDVGPATDALALLRFGAKGGFLAAAVAGLVRTFFSDYRQVRARLGLRQMDEREAIDVMARHGLVGRRVHPNLGHNQARMAFLARAADRAKP